ncbi:FAD-dependent oxidoreductase [Amycolatopsis rubida]|uniref:2-polyprenyl-6-methoxyphenol hydroxylase n=1 Tax=Amycolatopsis rubida TaxID=112413 RepID=A0A1I5Z1I1_9PSEU|nr:NAD(P)/FAD-dependent oxidoreductase [Amycolatopsis rubida]SFQ50282.1 2-polyprenyl-6-methoxyphenol hydroxylase [Amycolatopsis rubida]
METDREGMTVNKIKVAVVGGGTGGLCLAHGLARAGVEVAVYERSRTRTERLQGYRVHIAPMGSAALHECLPAEAWERFLATTGESKGVFGFVTEQMRELAVLDAPPSGDPAAAHHSASRISMHQVLSSGLDDVLWHGKEFVRYETGPKGVGLHFADGTTAEADLVVGADGANSRVRAQLLPHAKRADTGIRTVIGKFPLNAESVRQLPERLATAPTYVLPPAGSGMFTAPHEFPAASANDESAALDPVLFDNTGSYVMWSYGAKAGLFPGDLAELAAPALRSLMLERIRGWHPAFSRLVRDSPDGTVSMLPIRTSVPVREWEPGPVTLLGDAVHSMTPFRGIGANIALRDAQVLCRNLSRGGDVTAAVADYERQMRKYAYPQVRGSLRSAGQFVTESRFSRRAMRASMTVLGAGLSLRRKLRG